MAKYHIKKDGTPGICRAKVGNCPLGGEENHYDSIEDARFEAERINDEKYGLVGCYHTNIFEKKKREGELYSMLEANERALWVEEQTSNALLNGMSSRDLYYNNEYEMWSQERIQLHNKLLNKLEEKYKNVPEDGKVIISSGLPGAGKTTVLTRNLGISLDDYATISSDDFKEMLAEEGAIPKIDGLTDMEASTLVHEESSQLADAFLNRMTDKKKNIIYDCTCKNIGSTRKRLGSFVNKGYNTNDIQLVYVDIPIETAHERAKYRYREGLNTSKLGGRHLPSSIIDSCKAENSSHESKNAETVLDLSDDRTLNLPTPIIYDNSGSAPVELDFIEFKEG